MFVSIATSLLSALPLHGVLPTTSLIETASSSPTSSFSNQSEFYSLDASIAQAFRIINEAQSHACRIQFKFTVFAEIATAVEPRSLEEVRKIPKIFRSLSSQPTSDGRITIQASGHDIVIDVIPDHLSDWHVRHGIKRQTIYRIGAEVGQVNDAKDHALIDSLGETLLTQPSGFAMPLDIVLPEFSTDWRYRKSRVPEGLRQRAESQPLRQKLLKLDESTEEFVQRFVVAGIMSNHVPLEIGRAVRLRSNQPLPIEVDNLINGHVASIHRFSWSSDSRRLDAIEIENYVLQDPLDESSPIALAERQNFSFDWSVVPRPLTRPPLSPSAHVDDVFYSNEQITNARQKNSQTMVGPTVKSAPAKVFLVAFIIAGALVAVAGLFSKLRNLRQGKTN